MIKFIFILLFLSCFSTNVFADNFEDVTCSVTSGKSDLSPITITGIKLGKIIRLSKKQISEYGGVWNQKTDSNKFIEVEVYIKDGNVNRSLYRVVNGKLHQSFPAQTGEYMFRTIYPAIYPKKGWYAHVNIKGSSLQTTFLDNISCEKNIF